MGKTEVDNNSRFSRAAVCDLMRGFEEKGLHIALKRHSVARKELTTSGRERAEPWFSLKELGRVEAE